MSDIKFPELSKLRRQCKKIYKKRQPKLKTPQLRIINKRASFMGLYASIYEGIKNSEIKVQSLSPHVLITEKSMNEKQGTKPLSAGRGGKHMGMVSSMGRIAESGIEKKGINKNGHVPYKPIPQMHTLHSLRDIFLG